MCDKNGQRGIQWNKAATAAGEVKHVTNTIMAHLSNSAGVPAAATRVPQLCDNVHKTAGFYSVDNPYATTAAHFQTPVIHHAGIVPVIASTANTVAGSSGFVAPFPASSTPAASSAVHSHFSNVPANTAPLIAASGPRYGLEQFPHLNAQQKLELSKIISVVTTSHASPSTTATTISLNKTLSSSATAIQTALPADSGSSSSKNNEIISSVLAEKVLGAISATPNVSLQTVTPTTHGRLMGIGVAKEPDFDKLRRIQQVVENNLSEHAKQQITQILEGISTLRPVEKLLLYLRLPGDVPETDPLRQPQNPLGTRTEINHTINWVRTHLEHDPQVSIPKQDVYDDYLVYCERLQIKPLSTADFGKVMKQVFPGIRPRRLGTRGHSRYCYAAMRKTVSLAVPQIPALQSSEMQTKREQQQNLQEEDSKIQKCDTVSWSIIQTWAEQVLQTKVESLQELVASINSQKHNKSPVAQKKRVLATQRELKEKGSLSDVGPVKKRRKKKRKGSSSSESSSNCFNNNNNSNGLNNNKKTEIISQAPSVSEDDQKPTTALKYNTLNIKQEITDSPITPQIQQQYQQMPINLVTEQRNVLAKLSIVGSAQQIPDLNVATTGRNIRSPAITYNSTAARNVTPKIMELAGSTSTSVITAPTIKEEVVDDYSTPTIYCKKVLKAHQTKGFWINSPLAQQATTAVTSTVTTITAVHTITATSAGTASLNLSGGVIMDVNEATTSSNIDPPVQQQQQQYLMGPPAHMANNISTSPLAVLSDNSGQTIGGNINNAGPKVASRNMLLLRAKRQLAMAAAAAAQASTTAPSNTVVDVLNDDKEGAELPENLGLPRERVISICNMDKHELDDYFLPGQDEEETQEEQDTELLQYFQTGDAEEKLNSLDANKTSPTTTVSTSTDGFATANELTSSAAKRTSDTVIATSALTPTSLCLTTTAAAIPNNNKCKLLPITNTFNKNITNDSVDDVVGDRQLFALSGELVDGHENSAATKTIKPTVGSASASLSLLSQKHQQQQQQYQQMYNKHHKINRSSNNNDNNSRFFDKDDILNTARKNRIFLPISPNIKAATTPINQSCASTTTANASGGGLFASPWLIANITSTLMNKESSLDSDNCSDPMIGANRRKRNFMSSSASAPPSPSIFQEQQKAFKNLKTNKNFNAELRQRQIESEQQQQHCQVSAKNDNSDLGRLNNILCFQNDVVIDQNSIDLDLFEPLAQDSTTTKNVNNDILSNVLSNANEAYRSQSVPLLQLQRVRSPFVKHDNLQTPMSLYNPTGSVPQTPIPLPNFPDAYNNSTTKTNVKTLNGIEADIQLEESSVVASDSTALLDDVDCTVMLSSPELLSKFDCIAQTRTAATSITCFSSATSSSGYCSGAYSSTISRSVPSTPLPHHQHSFGNYYGHMGRKGAIDDYLQLSPTMTSGFGGCTNNSTFRYANSSSAMGPTYTGCGYDISKSMPTTPITTPCFRYSPTEFSRDFLINGNTLDSHHNFSTGSTNTDTDLRTKSSNGLVSVGMNVDSLIFNEGITDVSLETFVNNNDSEGIMVGATLLDDF